MIGQYLSNTNESVTIHILQKNLELNKALLSRPWISPAPAGSGCRLPNGWGGERPPQTADRVSFPLVHSTAMPVTGASRMARWLAATRGVDYVGGAASEASLSVSRGADRRSASRHVGR